MTVKQMMTEAFFVNISLLKQKSKKLKKMKILFLKMKHFIVICKKKSEVRAAG